MIDHNSSADVALHPPPGSSIEERRRARERVAEASEAYFLLADSGNTDKLEKIGEVMDAHASVFRDSREDVIRYR